MAADNFQSSSLATSVLIFTSFPKLFLVFLWITDFLKGWKWRQTRLFGPPVISGRQLVKWKSNKNPPPPNLHWFHILEGAQTGVWAPFDLFSSFSVSLGFGFGFAGGAGGRVVGTSTGSGSGAFFTSVNGSFIRVSHCQSCSSFSLLHLFKEGGFKML